MRPVRTFDFIVVLKKTSTKIVDIISILMLAIAVMFFVYSFTLNFATSGFTPKLVLLNLCTLGIIAWVVFSKRQEKNGLSPNYRFAVMLAAWGWFMIGVWYLAIAYLIAAVFERTLKVAPEYAFDENEIVVNTFPQKKYSWNEVTNVLLRFGMLTIDFKNNKIFQGEVNDNVPLEVENDFNNFCRQQLLKQNDVVES
ncbi:MAG: hypothetical protein NTZ59_14900 [Bacteroidetes bacterium]|nr:hypothetical protein [Bacteroidota bacterium]